MTHKATRGRIFRATLLLTGTMTDGWIAEMLRYDGAHPASAADRAAFAATGRRTVNITSMNAPTVARFADFGAVVLSVNGVSR